MATERTNKQISTTVSQELHTALVNYRFDNRIEKIGDVLKLAVEEFVTNHNIVTAPADVEAADDEAADGEAADEAAPAEKSNGKGK